VNNRTFAPRTVLQERTDPVVDAVAPKGAGRTTVGNRVPWDYIVLVAIIVFGATLPFVATVSTMAIAMRVLVFAIMGIGWNIMSGFGGMFSFGHAAYFGIGAYSTALLLVRFEISPWIGMLAGMAIAALAGMGLSYLALRYKLQGAYYAMATFAFAEVLRLFAFGNGPLHRQTGFTIPVRVEESFWMFQFKANSPWYYWIGLIMVAAAMLVSIVFVRSKTGRYTMAVRDDDVAAAALGLNALRYRLTAVAVSAAVTAMAGTLYVQYYMFIDPSLAFGPSVSNDAIITAVVGGTGTIWGPLVGAVVMGPLSDLTTAFLRNPPQWLAPLAGHDGVDIILYAIVLIAVVILLPKGIYGTIRGKVTKR
jgi:branched-chain amino acid transport system permease protein